MSLRRFHHDQRGELTIVGWTVVAVIVAVGPATLVGISLLFEGSDAQSTIGGPKLDTATVAGPAPPDNQCARDAYSGFGLSWNDPVPGWSIAGHTPPTPDDPDYKNKLRIYKAVILERVKDARSLWIERDCHKPQPAIEHPSPARSSEAPPISVSGTYLTTEDKARSSYDLPDVENSLGCSGRAIPPEMTFTVNGTAIVAKLADTPGQPAYTNNGEYDPSSGTWSATYPDGQRFLSGRFFVQDDKVYLADGLMYTGDCALAFSGEKRS